MSDLTPRARRSRRAGRTAALVATAGLLLGGLGDPVEAALVPVEQNAPRQIVGLRQGDRGAEVKLVQQALIAKGIAVVGGADGVFGPATKAAVLEFQAQRGLSPSGMVDAPTAEALGLSGGGTTAGTGGAVLLSQGAQGAMVKEMQQRLIAAGVYVAGGADGVFGPATTKALSDYQRWNGLAVTGVLDEATAAKLGMGQGTPPPPDPTPTPPPPDPPPTPDPPPVSTNPYVGLKQGDTGAKVKELQQALIGKGVAVPGGADGQFGPATKRSLITFQSANGTTANGVVGERDAELLGLGQPAAPPPPTPDPPPVSTNPYVGLKQGDTGAKVKELQQALIGKGVAVPGGADGQFGPATKRSLITFQSANGTTANGVVGERDAELLGLGQPAAPPPPTPDPPPVSTNPYVGLKQGDTGAKVKELQQALIGKGVAVPGGADGQFGPATKRSLITFQSANGITPTGVVTERGATILGLGQPAAPPPPDPEPVSTNSGGWPVFGEVGQRVRLMQQALLNAGIAVPGGADGDFGPATSGAIIKFQRREKLAVNGTIDDQTAAALGLTKMDPPAPPATYGVKLDVFPVQGTCWFGDTWHAPRSGNRVHEGVDIIANQGKLLYAVVNGTISKQYWDYPGALAGNGFRLTQDDGTYFTYLHLSAFADNIEVGSVVKAGQVIGYVGTTGSSATPHLHFEIHPGGGEPVNPYPFVKAINACDVTTPLPPV